MLINIKLRTLLLNFLKFYFLQNMGNGTGVGLILWDWDGNFSVGVGWDGSEKALLCHPLVSSKTTGITNTFTFQARSSCSLNPRLFLNFFMFFLMNVTITWYCFVKHQSFPLFFVNHHHGSPSTFCL